MRSIKVLQKYQVNHQDKQKTQHAGHHMRIGGRSSGSQLTHQRSRDQAENNPFLCKTLQ